jgi:hypothetical protein
MKNTMIHDCLAWNLGSDKPFQNFGKSESLKNWAQIQIFTFTHKKKTGRGSSKCSNAHPPPATQPVRVPPSILASQWATAGLGMPQASLKLSSGSRMISIYHGY